MENPSNSISLRDHHTAVIRVSHAGDETLVNVRYVIDAATGGVVFPADRRGPDAIGPDDDIVLFIPDEGFGAIEVMGPLRVLDPGRDGACDRWMIYHGASKAPQWLMMMPEAARVEGLVLEERELLRPNPIRADEGRVCRAINATPGAAGRLGQAAARTAVSEATLVGVDDRGADVRTRIGIIRVHFAAPVETGAAAEAQIRRMIAGDHTP